LSAADQRAAEVRAARPIGPKRPRSDAAPAHDREEWIDDGPMRTEAEAAVSRAAGDAPARRKRTRLAPDVVEEVRSTSAPARAARHEERLASAMEALGRDRYPEARRLAQQVAKELPELAAAQEIIGLASYRLGEWRKAAAALELARMLEGTVRHHAVLADCYRAMKRYDDVDALWREVRESSPHPALMAEARIVAAGAKADQGDLAAAITIMGPVSDHPKRVRDHHLRQWYVMGDLYDRAGDPIRARRYFRLVYGADAEFVDVADRLNALGR
jgi:tetratricopeptide (TPR) repeat protein